MQIGVRPQGRLPPAQFRIRNPDEMGDAGLLQCGNNRWTVEHGNLTNGGIEKLRNGSKASAIPQFLNSSISQFQFGRCALWQARQEPASLAWAESAPDLSFFLAASSSL